MIKTIIYGLQPPTINADLVENQIYKGHQYQNGLIEIEIKKRNQIRELDAKFGLEQLSIKYNQSLQDYFLIDQEIKKANSEARTKVQTKEQTEKRKLAKAEIKKSKDEFIQARKFLKEIEQYSIGRENLHQEELNLISKLTKQENSPWWGTYLLIRQAMNLTKAMPYYNGIDPNNPKFKRFNGEGRIGIGQFQPNETLLKVMDGTSKFLQILRSEKQYGEIQSRNFQNKKGKKDFRILKLRVNSDEKSKPIWAEFPMLYHRPLPANCAITTVQISKYKLGPQIKWEAAITFEDNQQQDLCPQTKNSAIAFDLGWREYEDRIVIATYEATNGEKGEVSLPTQIIKKLRKAEDLESIRDKEFNLVKPRLVKFLEEAKELPDWIKEKCQTLSQWKSKKRLSSLVNYWKVNRFDGDNLIFDEVEKWRYHDFHLWDWASHQRNKAIGHRREEYRKLAAKFADKYNTLIFENINLANLAMGNAGSSNRQLTAPSEFRDACKNATRTRNKNYVEVAAANTSKDCNNCGHRNKKTNALIFNCEGCGIEIQRDSNAASNILKKFIETLPGQDCERSNDEENPATSRTNDFKGLEVDEALALENNFSEAGLRIVQEAIENKYRQMERGHGADGLQAEIERLDKYAAQIIRTRTNKTMSKVEDSLRAAAKVARELLHKK